MKNFLYIVLFLFSWNCYSQRKYEAFDVINDTVIVPPNGIFLYANVFMDDTEVMNSHYLEYLHFLAQDSSDESIIRAYPDTSIFGRRHLEEFLKQSEKYYKKSRDKHRPVSLLHHDEEVFFSKSKHHWWNYFSYHGTRHFPVVGISYEQALLYCKWRSDLITHHFNNVLARKTKYKAFRNKNVEFKFTLPTERDWETAAADGLDPDKFSSGFKEVKDSLHSFNIKFHSDSLNSQKKEEPQLIYSHIPNQAGFYNMIGNVSEMTSDKGISKGGSFHHKFSQCKIKNRVLYSRPQKWLGFRCVCIVTVSQSL